MHGNKAFTLCFRIIIFVSTILLFNTYLRQRLIFCCDLYASIDDENDLLDIFTLDVSPLINNLKVIRYLHLTNAKVQVAHI